MFWSWLLPFSGHGVAIFIFLVRHNGPQTVSFHRPKCVPPNLFLNHGKCHVQLVPRGRNAFPRLVEHLSVGMQHDVLSHLSVSGRNMKKTNRSNFSEYISEYSPEDLSRAWQSCEAETDQERLLFTSNSARVGKSAGVRPFFFTMPSVSRGRREGPRPSEEQSNIAVAFPTVITEPSGELMNNFGTY